MMEQTKHTELPWSAEIARWKDDAPCYGFALRAEGKLAAICGAGVNEPHNIMPGIPLSAGSPMLAQFYTPEEVEANAALIVRAVNSHAELVEALDRAESRLILFDVMAESGEHTDIPSQFDIIKIIRAALARAKGEA